MVVTDQGDFEDRQINSFGSDLVELLLRGRRREIDAPNILTMEE